MKRVIAVLTTILLVVSVMTSCSSPGQDADRLEISGKYIDAFIDQDFRELGRFSLTFRMRWSLNNSAYKQIKNQLENEFGTFEERISATETASGEYIIVSHVCRYSKGYGNLNVVFDRKNRIAGFNYTFNKTYKENDEALEVVFGSEFKLPGSLLIPDQDPMPALLIVHGSGPGDRNGAFGGNAVYFDIAEGLYEKGIASLRYDKRTLVYQDPSDYDMDTFTVYDETIDDVVEAFEFLKAQPEIDEKRIYIAGHSLGGYLMPRIAKEIPEAAGFIMLAPSASPLEDLMIRQMEYIYGLDGNLTRTEKNTLEEYTSKAAIIKGLEPGDVYGSNELLNAPVSYWLDLKGYDPVNELRDEDRPVLIIHGGRDYQVDMMEYGIWGNAAAGMDNVESLFFDDLNHMLAYGEGESTPQEYYSLAEVDERVIRAMSDFIQGD